MTLHRRIETSGAQRKLRKTQSELKERRIMIMKKKIVFLLALATICAAAMAGCGSTSEPKDDVVIKDNESDKQNVKETTDDTKTDTTDGIKTDTADGAKTEAADDTKTDTTDDTKNDTKSESEIEKYFIGEHKRSYDESVLTISDKGDGTFGISLCIVKLCNLENGTGTYKDGKMTFVIEDPSDGKLSGEISRETDNSLTVKITDSTWGLINNGDVFDGFGK